MMDLLVLLGKKKSAGCDIEVTHCSRITNKAKHTERKKEEITETITTCYCCGSALRHRILVEKVRCIKCRCTVELAASKMIAPSHKTDVMFPQFKDCVNWCEHRYQWDSRGKELNAEEKHAVFSPVEGFIEALFSSVSNLNAFSSTDTKKFDLETVTKFYDMILRLPTNRPFYKLLIASNERLKRPHVKLSSSAEMILEFNQLHWILMIFENPRLKSCLVSNVKEDSAQFATPQIRVILYEVLKRCVGYMALMEVAAGKEFLTYLQSLSMAKFDAHVDLINLYVTFHFSRILNMKSKTVTCLSSPNLDEFYTNLKIKPKRTRNEFETIPQIVNRFWNNGSHNTAELPASFKFNVSDYGNDWHIKTAVKLASFYFAANKIKERCTAARFYNSLIDYVDYKKDFDLWRALRKGASTQWPSANAATSEDAFPIPLSLSPMNKQRTEFTICQYPYLLSLGVKISILEYDIRKIMQYNAEQAFLKALDKKQVLDVYLRVKVRRDSITQDSLRCIETNLSDLKKSLKIEFVDEPGIDAGGLRKEWFLLLTRELFNPDNGLFTVIEESRFSWFNIAYTDLDAGKENAHKLYFLLGVVLGLAIYNGTILDLSFPMALYKKMKGEPLKRADFLQLYPISGNNLLKLLEYDNDDFEEIFSLTFEITYPGAWDTWLHKKELCSGGSTRHVTRENREEYINLWMDFHMTQAIGESFVNFSNGFQRVVDNHAFELFTPEEVELLLCGSHEKEIDVSVLKSVTKYSIGLNRESRIVQWLWEIIYMFSHAERCKLAFGICDWFRSNTCHRNINRSFQDNKAGTGQ